MTETVYPRPLTAAALRWAGPNNTAEVVGWLATAEVSVTTTPDHSALVLTWGPGPIPERAYVRRGDWIVTLGAQREFAAWAIVLDDAQYNDLFEHQPQHRPKWSRSALVISRHDRPQAADTETIKDQLWSTVINRVGAALADPHLEPLELEVHKEDQ